MSRSAKRDASRTDPLDRVRTRSGNPVGVFYDLAQHELEKLPPGTDRAQVRAVMARAWDSVENRMGQLTYNNLFWHRYLKDGLMASVRSVGWNRQDGSRRSSSRVA
jgi:hypothetical protein